MRGAQLSLVTAAGLSLASCGMASIRGSGNVIDQPRAVSGFNAVSLGGSGKLLIEQDGTESLTITADDNILPHLTSEVKGGELRLGPRDESVSPSREIIYRLTVKDLDEISVSGSADVVAHRLNTERLEVSLSGSTNFTATGNAEQQDIKISGSGEYQGGDLKSRIVSIGISGSGNAVLAVSEKLDVDVSGSGSVDYIGRPAVTQNISGSGSVQPR